jgi:hypothetical protein
MSNMTCKILHGMYVSSQEQCKKCYCGLFERNLSYAPKFKCRPYTPIQISGISTKQLPYGFGIYARKYFKSTNSNVKSTKIYSSYTFDTRISPSSYTCVNTKHPQSNIKCHKHYVHYS